MPVPASVSASGVDRDAAAERDARALDELHGDPAGRLERDQGSGRECARLQLQLVVHDFGCGHDAADGGGCDSCERRVERQFGDERERDFQRGDLGGERDGDELCSA